LNYVIQLENNPNIMSKKMKLRLEYALPKLQVKKCDKTDEKEEKMEAFEKGIDFSIFSLLG